MSARKYLTAGRISLQESLIYRANAVVWMIVDSLPAYTMLLIWTAVYRDRTLIGGYALGDMVAYYLAATFLGVVINPHPEYDMSYEIRQGILSAQLVRPWSYFMAVACATTSWQLVKGAASLPLFLFIGWVFRTHLHWPQLSPTLWPVCALAVLAAYLINVAIKMTLGALSFWMLDSGGVIGIHNSLKWFLEGGVVPLDLLPAWLQSVCALLPFPYTLAFPIQLLLGRLPTQAVLPGLLTQFGWLVACWTIAGLCWRRGLRAYTAVGG